MLQMYLKTSSRLNARNAALPAITTNASTGDGLISVKLLVLGAMQTRQMRSTRLLDATTELHPSMMAVRSFGCQNNSTGMRLEIMPSANILRYTA